MSRTPSGRIRARGGRAMVLVVVGLTAVYVFVGDRTVWGEWISVMPPVLWVLALSPAVVLLRRPMLLLVLVLFMIITSEWPRFGGSRVPARGTIRVVSWNIGSGFSGWAEAVAPLKPDIVLVQESAPPSVLPEGFHWYGAVDPGTLSRFPATVLPSAPVGAWTDPQLLLMEISGRKVLVANVRLMHPSVVMALVDRKLDTVVENYRSRIAQYEKLSALLKAAAVRSDAQAILLGGDFNIPAQMPSLDPLRGFLQDAWLTADSGWGATMPEDLPLVRIDHLWLSSQIEPISVRVVRLAGSDHQAVVADIKFRF
jgi:hypothetical protein